MIRYFIELSYDGQPYHGWQVQDNAVSVQGEILDVLRIIVDKEVELMGCGRTDTGVHAKCFTAHMDINKEIDCDLIKYKMNGMLSNSIAIHRIFEVKEDMHARFSAKSRAYRYYMTLEKNPFQSSYAYYFNKDLDVDLMNKACKVLIGTQDFSCFSKSRTQVKTNICDVQEAYWVQQGNDLVFYVKANRFLRNMVRAIVGTCLEIGQKRKEVSFMIELIASKNRKIAGTSVPGHGLFLEEVVY